MQDRGTIIAGAGIAVACLVAAVVFLFFQRQDAMERAQDAQAEAEHQQDIALQRQLAANQQGGMQVIIGGARAPRDAMAAGWTFLKDQQSADGAWRSDRYAPFKSGTALTPQVVIAMQSVHRGDMDGDAIRAGCDWLARLVKPDGTIEGAEGDLDFPVYTAALSVVALSHPDQKRHAKARDAWLKFLLSHQLTETLGWKPEDKQYGGWGYCRLLPKKPEPGALAPPLVESNLSATVFSLEALKAAGVTDKDVYSKALAFVRRCQNHIPADEVAGLSPAYFDGGFSFIYDDPVRNKAGLIQPRAKNRIGFSSYGSATADGLRSLRLAGETDALRIKRAKDWLEVLFRADAHPGTYVSAHEPNRDAVYFYYAASVAKAIGNEQGDGLAVLAKELVKRQQPNGSWANPLNLVREDEPLVATSHALIALANSVVK